MKRLILILLKSKELFISQLFKFSYIEVATVNQLII